MEKINDDVMSMEELLKQEEARELHVHDVVKGEVVEVTDKYAKINLNTFTEGTIYLDHFTTDKSVSSLKELVKLGDTIEAEVSKISENSENSEILLSRLNTLKLVDFEEFKNANPVETNIEAKVIKVMPNRGYILSNGKINMFMSYKDLREPNLPLNQGEVVSVKILSYDDTKKNAYVSRFAAIREERRHAYEERQQQHEEYVKQREAERAEYNKEREVEYNSYNVGDVLKGTVANVLPFGAFVKFDKVQGLIHVKDITHSFVKTASDVLKTGDEVEVKVISKEDGKLGLSRKSLMKTPYNEYKEAHQVSDTVKGKVTNKMPFGVLVELAPNVKGLLHKTEFSWNPNDNLMASLKLGDEIELSIIKYEDDKEKIGLSRKPLIDNPWARIDASEGDVVEVKITEVLDRGFKIETLGVDGYTPFNQVDTGEKNAKATEIYAVGDTFTGVVTELDSAKWHLVVSEKAYKNKVEREQFENYMNDDHEENNTTLGDLFKGKI